MREKERDKMGQHGFVCVCVTCYGLGCVCYVSWVEVCVITGDGNSYPPSRAGKLNGTRCRLESGLAKNVHYVRRRRDNGIM